MCLLLLVLLVGSVLSTHPVLFEQADFGSYKTGITLECALETEGCCVEMAERGHIVDATACEQNKKRCEKGHYISEIFGEIGEIGVCDKITNETLCPLTWEDAERCRLYLRCLWIGKCGVDKDDKWTMNLLPPTELDIEDFAKEYKMKHKK